MQTAISQCLGKIIEGLATQVEETIVQQSSSSSAKPDFAPLRQRVTESAAALSRLASVIRTCEALRLPPPSSASSSVSANRVVSLGASQTSTSASVVTVPSFAAREALRRASKRLRGEDDDCEVKRCENSANSANIRPLIRPISLVEGLQRIMAPPQQPLPSQGEVSAAMPTSVNPAANSNVVVRKGRRPEFNKLLGSASTAAVNNDVTNKPSLVATTMPPPFGSVMDFLSETQGAQRSVLLRFGHIPSLNDAGRDDAAAGTNGQPAMIAPAALTVAMDEYSRLQSTAEALMMAEHLTLVTLAQLYVDLPEIVEKVGAVTVADNALCTPHIIRALASSSAESPSSSPFGASAARPATALCEPLPPVTILRVQGGVASLSLRGMCIVNVMYSESVRKWSLVGFLWTVFDCTDVSSEAAALKNTAETAATVGEAPSPSTAAVVRTPVLSLAHFAHQQVQQRVAMEMQMGLLNGIVAALRCCSAAVLQHTHNAIARRDAAAASASSSSTSSSSFAFTLDGFACRSKTDVSRNGSITLFCQPKQSVTAATMTTTVRIFHDQKRAALLKSTLEGTDIDAERARFALDIITLREEGGRVANGAQNVADGCDRGHKEEEASSDSVMKKAIEASQLPYSVYLHVLFNMGRMAGLAVPLSEEHALKSREGAKLLADLEEKLPTLKGTPVALLALPTLLSPKKC